MGEFPKKAKQENSIGDFGEFSRAADLRLSRRIGSFFLPQMDADKRR